MAQRVNITSLRILIDIDLIQELEEDLLLVVITTHTQK